MSDIKQVTTLKKDALVNISLSAGFVKNLSTILYQLVQEVSEEQIKEFRENIANDVPLVGWQLNYYCIQQIIQEVYNKGKEQGQTEERDTSLA